MKRYSLFILAGALAWSTGQSVDASPGSVDPMFAKWHVPGADYVFQPQELKPHWAKRLEGYLPARDGTELRYSVLLPAGKGPFPVIINYSGYDPGAIGGLAYLHNDTTFSTSLDQTLLDHGFAVMGLQARGTGCSQGTFDF